MRFFFAHCVYNANWVEKWGVQKLTRVLTDLRTLLFEPVECQQTMCHSFFLVFARTCNSNRGKSLPMNHISLIHRHPQLLEVEGR